MEPASLPSFPRRLVFNICEDTNQFPLENIATVCYYDVARDMVVRLADGEVSHGFLYNNDNCMREYIFDNNTWRSQHYYDAELGSSHGEDNDDEDCAYTSEEDDDEEEQQQG